MARRVLLTGGTGFFGKSLLNSRRQAPESGVELVVLSRDSGGFRRAYPELAMLPGVNFIDGDVRDFVFPEGDFDAVIHAATPAATKTGEDELVSIIADGTRRVLDFAVSRGVSKLLLASSGAVYGPMPEGAERFTEAMACRPVSAYGRGKLRAEEMCLASPVRCVVARCFAFAGEYLPLDLHFAIGNFIGDCLGGRPIRIAGDGSAVRSYLYAGDLVEWLWRLLDGEEANLAVNVGSDRAITILELAHLVRERMGCGNEIIVEGGASSGGRYVPDISLARERFGLEVKTPLELAIDRMSVP